MVAISTPRDNNRKTMLTGVLNTDGTTVKTIYVNPVNNAVKTIDAQTGSDHSTSTVQRDANRATTIWGVSSSDGITPVSIYVDTNNNLLIDSN